MHFINLGAQTILAFCGPDAVRFLNGQITQDARQVVGAAISLPSCITDAKGHLQFRINLLENETSLWITGNPEWAESLEARLTRYLIADDVEVTDLSAAYQLIHFIGSPEAPPPGVIAKQINRYGLPGMDWWAPSDLKIELPPPTSLLSANELEALRITHKVPAWGSELHEGMLPPEALLESTDISYNKGCYIGQEVISRIKSAGKVNKYLTRFSADSNVHLAPGPLENREGKAIGEITSVSALSTAGTRHALGYIKRGSDEVFYPAQNGERYPLAID